MTRTTRPLRAAALVALIPMALGAAGCWEGPGVEQVRWAVERQLPGSRFDSEVHVRLGRLTTGFARWIVNLALDDSDRDERLAKTIVGSVRRVEVAVYANRRPADPEALAAVALPRSLERVAAREGWQVLIEAGSAGERSWVLTRQDAGAIRSLYVVALDPAELTVVRLEGRFDEAFARALARRPKEAAERMLEGSGVEG